MSDIKKWKKVKFGELANQKSNRVDNPKDSGYERYVGLEHLDSGQLIIKRWGSTEDVISTMKLFNKGDILFARRNTYLKRVSLANFKGVCSGDIIVIAPILKEIVEGFLPILMQFEQLENTIISLSAGAFSKRIKWKQLIEEEISIPPKSEQKKIVNLIWAIQDNIEKTENLIEINGKLKKGLLNELLTRGLGHKKFKKTEIGEIPEEWKVLELGNITQLQKGISYKSENLSKNKENNYLLNLKSFNKKGGINFEGYKLYKGDYNKKFIAKPGDLIIANTDITRDAEVIGYPAIVPNYNTKKDILFTMDVSKINLTSNKINLNFLYLYLLTNKAHDFMYSYSSGTTVLHLKTSKVLNLHVPIPSIKEQEKIIRIFKKVGLNKQNLLISLQNLIELKKKLSNELLLGKLKLK